MAYSITIRVDASGAVLVEATDHLGGCAYPVAARKGGDLLDNLIAQYSNPTPDEVVERMTQLEWSEHLERGWYNLRPHVARAIREIAFCLPPPETFDEEGRPRRIREGEYVTDGERDGLVCLGQVLWIGGGVDSIALEGLRRSTAERVEKALAREFERNRRSR